MRNITIKMLSLAVAIMGLGNIAMGSLVAYWPLDEGTGSTAFAAVGSINGTLTGGASFVPSGISGGAVSFNSGTSDLVDMGNNFSFTTGSFSMVGWVKTNPGDTAPLIPFGKHYTGTINGYFLAVNDVGDGAGAPANNKAHLYATNPGTPSTTVVNDGQWHQIVGAYDTGSTLMSLYVDGVLQASNPIAPINPNSAPFLVGGLTVAGVPTNVFNGLIDEVRLYDNALSSTDVATLYTSTLPEPASLGVVGLGAMIVLRRKPRN